MSPELQWFGDHGFLKAEPNGVYDEDYFAKYQKYAETPLGLALNRARLELVNEWLHPGKALIDVGIGCGQFVGARGYTFGWDVNPKGVEWLEERRLLMNPWKIDVPGMSFWDSLEHIEDPSQVLEHCREFCFVSIPIFTDQSHVLRSKHYRPDEHYWYFVRSGFVRFMGNHGFRVVEHSMVETELGREDIESFVFQRVN